MQLERILIPRTIKSEYEDTQIKVSDNYDEVSFVPCRIWSMVLRPSADCMQPGSKSITSN
eukprot:UN19768